MTSFNKTKEYYLQKTICIALFLLYLAISLKKLSPTIFIGDSGELITAATSMGIPHPPGFPFFVITGKCLSLIPLGNLAWRINLLSVFAGAAAICLLFLLLLLGNLNERHALLLALFFSSGYVFLEITAGTEVYSLHLLILLLCFILMQNRFKSSLPIILLLCGVGIGVHVTTIFLLPVIVYYVIFSQPLKAKKLLIALLCLIMGTMVYLSLPLRATTIPLLNWGNPAVFTKFLAHVTNKKDAGLLKSWQLETILINAKAFSAYLNDAVTPGGIMLLILGIYLGIKRNRQWFVLLLIFALPFFILYLPLARLPRAHLYAPVFLVLPIMLSPLFERLPRYPFAKYLQTAALISLLAANLIRFLPLTNERNNYSVYDHASNFLKAAAPISHLAAVGDVTLYSLLYLKTIEMKRPDVVLGPNVPDITKIYPNITPNAKAHTLKEKLQQYPIQLTWANYDKSYFNLPLISNGVLYNLGLEAAVTDFTSFSYRGYSKINPEKDFWYQYMFINQLQLQANYYSEKGKYKKANSLLNKALAIGYDTGAALDLAENYLNLGNFSKASQIITPIVRKKPDIARARNIISRINEQQ